MQSLTCLGSALNTRRRKMSTTIGCATRPFVPSAPLTWPKARKMARMD